MEALRAGSALAAGALSGGSSCFLRWRDRCAGPAQRTTASSQDCLTESAPENVGEKKLPETVLFMACIIMIISPLTLSLLNTLLRTSVAPMFDAMSA